MAVRPIDIDGLTLDDVRGGALAGRPITVLGLARSGVALARFLHDAGARVTVYDGRRHEDLPYPKRTMVALRRYHVGERFRAPKWRGQQRSLAPVRPSVPTYRR